MTEIGGGIITLKDLLFKGLTTFLRHADENLEEQIAEAVENRKTQDILKAAIAMIEAKVKKEKISELLVKHWNLRPSEADSFIRKAENNLKK